VLVFVAVVGEAEDLGDGVQLFLDRGHCGDLELMKCVLIGLEERKFRFGRVLDSMGHFWE
jgi:hypothetical protein